MGSSALEGVILPLLPDDSGPFSNGTAGLVLGRMFDTIRVMMSSKTSCPLRDDALGLFEKWSQQLISTQHPSPRIRADLANDQWVRLWNVAKSIDWIGWRTYVNKEVEYMRVTYNSGRQPTMPDHGIPLYRTQLARHVERCEHIRSDSRPVIEANHPGAM